VTAQDTGKQPCFFKQVQWCGAFLHSSAGSIRLERTLTDSWRQSISNFPVHPLEHIFCDERGSREVEVWYTIIVDQASNQLQLHDKIRGTPTYPSTSTFITGTLSIQHPNISVTRVSVALNRRRRFHLGPRSPSCRACSAPPSSSD
jgi:hypothetical protein